MHEYEMRCFPKTHVFNPEISKQDFLSISPKKNQTSKHVLHQFPEILKLGWSDQKHTITCTQFSKE